MRNYIILFIFMSASSYGQKLSKEEKENDAVCKTYIGLNDDEFNDKKTYFNSQPLEFTGLGKDNFKVLITRHSYYTSLGIFFEDGVHCFSSGNYLAIKTGNGKITNYTDVYNDGCDNSLVISLGSKNSIAVNNLIANGVVAFRINPHQSSPITGVVSEEQNRIIRRTLFCLARLPRSSFK